jgi:uncharacterized iron-regulated membrane protein
MTLAKWSRKAHRIGALISALPLLVVILTGLLLQLKKHWDWVQPPTLRGSEARLVLGWDELLKVMRGVDAAEVASYEDIARIDGQPSKGLLKVTCENGYEVQIDGVSGAVLSVAVRRSDLIESLHDGSWFHPRAKLGVFFPAAIVLFALWVTGVHLWLVPHLVRRRRRKV